jgi:hypothetical protein
MSRARFCADRWFPPTAASSATRVSSSAACTAGNRETNKSSAAQAADFMPRAPIGGRGSVLYPIDEARGGSRPWERLPAAIIAETASSRDDRATASVAMINGVRSPCAIESSARATCEVSEIALGSWLTYGVGVDQRDARACLRAAFDAGINFIDTANVYGRGAAETLLGELLREPPARRLHPRDQALLPDVLDRSRLVAHAGAQADRRFAQAPANRSCRSLPVPSLRRGTRRSRRRCRR